MGVPLFSETPISPPKSLTSYRSVGKIWWFCPPSNFPHIGEQKKTQYLEISRLCGLTGNEAKMPIRWGWDHCSRKKKKRVAFSHHKIGLKFDIFNGRSQFVWHERKATLLEDSFLLGFFLATVSFIHVTSSLASNNYHDSAANFGKTCQPLFLPPIFFQINQYCINNNSNNNYPTRSLRIPCFEKFPRFPRRSRRRHNKCVGRVTSPRLRAPETRGKTEEAEVATCDCWANWSCVYATFVPLFLHKYIAIWL